MAVHAHDSSQRQPDGDQAPPRRLVQPSAPPVHPRDPAALASLASTDLRTRGSVLAALQRTAGNRSIAAVLAREPVPEAAAETTPTATAGSPEWDVSLTPGERGKDRPRGLGEGARVFRGDTITFRARFPGMSPDGHEFTQLTLSDGAAAGPVIGEPTPKTSADPPDPVTGPKKPGKPTVPRWETDDTYVLSVQVTKVGAHHLVCDASSQGERLGSKGVQLVSVMDVGDWKTQLDAASDFADAEFGDALTAITRTSKDWESAHERHEKVLNDGLAQERLVKDVMLAAFLAVLAGGAGGALAGFLKHTSTINSLNVQKTMVADMISTAITDAGKDGLKYAIRIMPTLGGVAGSTPKVAGDSVAPPTGGVPAPPKGGYVGEFMTDLLGQISKEFSMLKREIGRMKLAASDAMAVGSIAELSEDPNDKFTGDTKLDLLTKGFPTDWTKYLEGLWTAWLSNHAYALTVWHAHSDVVIDAEPRVVLKSNVHWPLHGYLEAEAETCGTTLDKWLEQYAAPLKEQLETERDRLNADAGEPQPDEPPPVGGGAGINPAIGGKVINFGPR